VFIFNHQGLYTEMKFERPSRIQATTLPMILRPPYRSMIAQVHPAHAPRQTLAVCLCQEAQRERSSVQATEAGVAWAWVLQAHNGSGKTTCFVLAMLSRVDVAVRQPQVSAQSDLGLS
jgi:ATP-dependent RNA helicase DDX19/DBP5